MRSAYRIKLLLFSLLGGFLVSVEVYAGDQPPAGKPVALWKLQGLGLKPEQVDRLREAIEKAFGRNPDWRLQPQRASKARLRRAGLDVRAPPKQQMVALGVRFVVTGTLAGLADEISLDCKLFDGLSGERLRRVSAALPSEPRSWPVELDEVIVRLLSPEKWVGGLDLEVSEAGARVLLDGVEVATTPLPAPLANLTPGKHILMIHKDGFTEFSQFVAIRYQQLARLEVDLTSSTVVGLIYDKRQAGADKAQERPGVPPAERPGVDERNVGWNWQQGIGFGCLGLGVAAVVAGGLLGWQANDLERRAEDALWVAEDEDKLKGLLDKGQRYARWSNRMFITGGALAVASAALLLWGTLADGEATATASGDRRPTVVLAPALTPSGLGVGLVGRF